MVSTAVSVSPHPSMCQMSVNLALLSCFVSSAHPVYKKRLKELHPVFLSQGISLYQQKGQPPSWLILYWW
jgi:hypothetical protein